MNIPGRRAVELHRRLGLRSREGTFEVADLMEL